jgi:hypothetical protein
MTSCIAQLLFSFYRHRPIRADFSGGQISSGAGLLPLRAFVANLAFPRLFKIAQFLQTTNFTLWRSKCQRGGNAKCMYSTREPARTVEAWKRLVPTDTGVLNDTF